jgi:uncharacterized membrane protein YdjX (TVP38/TMEM64 family)
VRSSVRSARAAWLAGAFVLALVAWQGHHVARWLPQLERVIAALGPWGPLALIVAILLLGPLLFPDSIFGIAAGVTFGLAAGTVYYFLGVYLMCLAVQLVSRRWLQERVLRRLESRPRLRAAVLAVPRGGVRSTFLIRLIPVNQALLSYALGAAGVPLRFALIGNAAMLTHLLPTVYFGAAAAQVTRMAGKGHRQWEAEGVLLMLGLGVCVWLTLQITHRAWAAIDGAEHQTGRSSSGHSGAP